MKYLVVFFLSIVLSSYAVIEESQKNLVNAPIVYEMTNGFEQINLEVRGTQVNLEAESTTTRNMLCFRCDTGPDVVDASVKVQQLECNPLCKDAAGNNGGYLCHLCKLNCLTTDNREICILGPGGCLCNCKGEGYDSSCFFHLFQKFSSASTACAADVARLFFNNVTPIACYLGWFRYNDEIRSVETCLCVDCGNYQKAYGTKGYCGPICLRCSVLSIESGYKYNYLCIELNNQQQRSSCSLCSQKLYESRSGNESID